MNVTLLFINTTGHISMILSFIQIILAYNAFRKKKVEQQITMLCVCLVCLFFEPFDRLSGDCHRQCKCLITLMQTSCIVFVYLFVVYLKMLPGAQNTERWMAR